MASSKRSRSIEESRFPQGTVVITVLVLVLLAGVFLIVQGLF